MTYKVYLAFNMLVQRQTYYFGFYCQYLWINIEKDVIYKLIFLSKDWILMFVLGILLNVHMHIYVKCLFIHVCVMIIWLIVSFIIISASSISANVNNIPVLNGTNFKKWKEHVIIVLGCMDLDFALREDRPLDLTSAQHCWAKVYYEKMRAIQSHESNNYEALNSRNYKGCNTWGNPSQGILRPDSKPIRNKRKGWDKHYS